jgi:hypothetical protein
MGVIGDSMLAAFALSTLASLAAGLLFHSLVRLDAPQDADRALWFLFAFPTSFTLHIGYTESLFLALAFGSLLCARRGRFALGAALAVGAGLTRINAVALVPALALEALLAQRDRRGRSLGLLAAAAPLLGLAGYLLMNQLVAGDAFAFLRYQESYFKRTADWPWNGLVNTWLEARRPLPPDAIDARAQEFFFGCLAVLGSAAAWRWLRPSYAAWITVNTVMILSFTLPWSLPRYALILFPLPLLFARLGRNPWAFAALSAWSFYYLARFAGQFACGSWAF